MEINIPRWEWRAFGQELGDAEARIRALPAQKVQTSEETYLVAAASDANVKIRDQLLDIKVLERVNSHGLEQWRPLIKEPFPLGMTAISVVRSALGLSGSGTASESLSLDQLLEAIAPSGGPVRVVKVSKTRTRYLVNGCVSEVTEIVAAEAKARTIAIEDADAAKVISAVTDFGLNLRPNMNYPTFLKTVIGLAPSGSTNSRRAVIDVGTNSVKFHVAEQKPDGTWMTIVDRADVTRLGEKLDRTSSINPEAMERTAAAIERMADEANRLGVARIIAVGTMGLRMATNRDQFQKLVRDRCGLEIEVISGDEEARIAYLGVRSGVGPVQGATVIFDTGGGSSQFTFGRENTMDRQFSLNVGAVRYTEKFGLDQSVSDDVLKQALDALARDLSPLDSAQPPDSLIGMGGAVTNIAAVKHGLSKYDPAVIQGSNIERAEIDRQIERYRSLPAEARRQIVGLQPKRAEVILAGACIVRTIMEKLKSSALTVSDRGLRHGLLLDRFGGQLR